jgi:hypothetical protein
MANYRRVTATARQLPLACSLSHAALDLSMLGLGGEKEKSLREGENG